MIDSHCHLVAPQFSADVDAVIERARVAGVDRMITISDALEDIIPSQKLAEKYLFIFFTAGVHPHHASSFDLTKDLATIRSAAAHPKCKSIGEIGLDYHYMNSPKDAQQRVFEAQLALAKELDLPAVVHCRDALNQSQSSGTGRAVEDVWTIVNHIKSEKLVIHCCTEKWEDVKRFVDAGYMLSFTGIATYPKSGEIRETIKRCPIGQLMIETDSPFLAPVPHRGKRCEPAYVLEVAKIVADVKGMSLTEVDRETTKNAVEFFSLRL